MKKLQLTLFEIISLLWLSTAVFLVLLALAGIFHSWAGVVFVGIAILGILHFTKKEKIEIEMGSKKDNLILAGLFAFGIFLSMFTTPTIFGGRDEGSFSNSAIMLSQSGSLKTSSAVSDEFFKIYGPGKALNFPGFSYSQSGELKSQFLPGYISWVGFWHGTFGLDGIKFANLLPLVTFLFSFYLVCKKLTGKENFSLGGLLLLAASLPMIVFYKSTLTELFFAAAIWFSLHLLLEYFKNRSFARYSLLLVPLSLIPFVRIEALGIVFALFCILIAFDFKNLRQARYQFLFLAIGASFALTVFTNSHFFVDSFKNFFDLSGLSGTSAKTIGSSTFLPDDWQSLFLPKVFFAYNLLPVLLLGLAAIIFLARKKMWSLLIPVFFLAPTLVYLVDANISLDHPWMLRRFVFSIIPLFVMYSVLLLSSLGEKFKTFSALFLGLLFFATILQSAPFAFFASNKGLLEQAKSTVSEKVSHNDLLLVARESSGSGWSLVSEPLRNIEGFGAVYFFNPEDLEKINREKFESIYLLASDSEKDLFMDIAKKEVSKYKIENSIIFAQKDPSKKPMVEKYQVSGSLYEIE